MYGMTFSQRRHAVDAGLLLRRIAPKRLPAVPAPGSLVAKVIKFLAPAFAAVRAGMAATPPMSLASSYSLGGYHVSLARSARLLMWFPCAALAAGSTALVPTYGQSLSQLGVATAVVPLFAVLLASTLTCIAGFAFSGHP